MSLVYVRNKKNQTTYVYESTAYWDKEKQQSRNTRVCIGKLVDNVFVPNKQYTMQQELEQLRQEKSVPSNTSGSSRKFYGATYLLEQIAERYGITEDLKRCFPDSYRQILSLAYFLILEENNTISRFPKWAATHALPYEQEIPSQHFSEFFRSVTEEVKDEFFRLLVARQEEQDYLSFDISSASSYIETFRQSKYRNANDHDTLAQINLTILSGSDSALPVCYRKLPDNLSDARTLKNMLKEFGKLVDGKIKFVLDRDFYSEENVNALFTNHYKFLMGTRVNLDYIQQHLAPVRETIRKRANYHPAYQLGCYSVMSVWPHERVKKRSGEIIRTEKRIYVHLYYSEHLAIEDEIAFSKRLDRLEEEVLTNKRVPSHEKKYETYFNIRQNSSRKTTLTLQQDAIEKRQRDFGYFSLISNDIKDPIEALETYQGRTMIESTFSNLKERLNLRGTAASYEQNLEGKLFVQFVAYIFIAAIDKTMREKDLYRTHTMTSLLDTLDMVEQYQRPGEPSHVGEVTEEQENLYAQFGFASPASRQ